MRESNNEVKISIIITSKNEGRYLKQTIENLKLPGSTTCEILVIDDGSQDHSARFLESDNYKKIRTLRTNGIGPTGARILGVEASKGEILVFLDAHIISYENWLEALASRFEDLEVCAECSGTRSIQHKSPGCVRPAP